VVLASATRRPRQLARHVVQATVAGHDIDIQVERAGRDYVAVLTVLQGELIFEEYEMPITWADLDEPTKLAVLRVYVAQVLLGHERWRRKMNRRLAILGVAPIPSPHTTGG